MLRQMAWNIFKNTGDINTFLELKQVQNIENNNNTNNADINSRINNISGEINGDYKNQGNSNTRK